MLRLWQGRKRVHFSKNARTGVLDLLRDEQGAALLEFAVTLPLLVVFVVGIYDFSGAFNQKQKIAQAAQEGAILAGAQPMNDIDPLNPNVNGPDSLQPVVTAVINSLSGNKVLAAAGCGTPAVTHIDPKSLRWTFTISNCSGANPGDNLVVTIDRGVASTTATPTAAVVGTAVTVIYPYHWRFGSVIQLLFPGPNGYLTPTPVTETATVHNQT